MVLLQTGISAHSLLVSVQRTIGDSSVNWFETRVCNNIQGTNSWGGRADHHDIEFSLDFRECFSRKKWLPPVLQLNSSISRSVYVVKELLEYLCGEHSQHLGIVPCEGERVDGSGWGMNVIPTGEDDLLTVDVQFDAPVQTDEVLGVKAVEMTRYIRRLGTLGLHSEELISGVSRTADEAVDLFELLKPVPLTIVQGKRLHIFWEAIEMRPELQGSPAHRM